MRSVQEVGACESLGKSAIIFKFVEIRCMRSVSHTPQCLLFYRLRASDCGPGSSVGIATD